MRHPTQTLADYPNDVTQITFPPFEWFQWGWVVTEEAVILELHVEENKNRKTISNYQPPRKVKIPLDRRTLNHLFFSGSFCLLDDVEKKIAICRKSPKLSKGDMQMGDTPTIYSPFATEWFSSHVGKSYHNFTNLPKWYISRDGQVKFKRYSKSPKNVVSSCHVTRISRASYCNCCATTPAFDAPTVFKNAEVYSPEN